METVGDPECIGRPNASVRSIYPRNIFDSRPLFFTTSRIKFCGSLKRAPVALLHDMALSDTVVQQEIGLIWRILLRVSISLGLAAMHFTMPWPPAEHLRFPKQAAQFPNFPFL